MKPALLAKLYDSGIRKECGWMSRETLLGLCSEGETVILTLFHRNFCLKGKTKERKP